MTSLVICILSLFVFLHVAQCHVLRNQEALGSFDWDEENPEVRPDFEDELPAESFQNLPSNNEERRQHWSYALSPGGKRQHWSLALSPGGKRQHWSNQLTPGGKRVIPRMREQKKADFDEINYTKIYNLLRQYLEAAAEYEKGDFGRYKGNQRNQLETIKDDIMTE
uniref:Preprogonadotropin-releasing hormone 2 n=1 Tax=Ciona intestinalis TaxID=7719 RepID=F6ZMJ0_CIOIN|nr:preprogonadotropin-releasing hormone 2 precursor [Ciona intestinalis]|eukprot:NP_001027800.2 preprogonadotropin-releasing hormone 2 precursor [Ciona intestinalis]